MTVKEFCAMNQKREGSDGYTNGLAFVEIRDSGTDDFGDVEWLEDLADSDDNREVKSWCMEYDFVRDESGLILYV